MQAIKKNVFAKLILLSLMAFAIFGMARSVHAMIPMLSLTAGSGGDSVTMSVTADPNSSITMYYTVNSVYQSRYIGMTNYSGYFSALLSAHDYNVVPGSSIYVIVNNQQSSYAVWPTTLGGGLSLSQTNVSIGVGQTASVTAYNTYGNLYVTNNTYPSVATTTVSGNYISIYGSSVGSTTITVCQSIYSSYCATIYVTVTGSSSWYSNTTLSLTSLTMAAGNTATVSFAPYGGTYNGTYTGTFTVTNSNPTVATTSYYTPYSSTGNVTITANAQGTTTIGICQSGTSFCDNVTVTVTQPQYVGQQYGGYQYQGGTCYLYRNLSFGKTGSDVYCLQSYLLSKGYLKSQSNLTSTFDYATLYAVVSFQRDNYLVADGVVGRLTRERLY